MGRVVWIAAMLAWGCQGGHGGGASRDLVPWETRALDAPSGLDLGPETDPGSGPLADTGPGPFPEVLADVATEEAGGILPESVGDLPPDPIADTPLEAPADTIPNMAPDPVPESIPDEASDSAPDAAEDPGPPAPPLILWSPEDGARAVVESPVRFAGSTGCRNATVTFTADGRYLFGTLRGVTGPFQYDYTFHNPGIDRRIEVTVAGDDGCSGTITRRLTVQPAFAWTAETRTDAAGNPFTVHVARFPTADPSHRLVVTGSASPHTVRWFATSSGVPGVVAAINGGYFAAGSGPVSYARGSTGYESPSGNVKGPRACLAWDQERRTARVVLSMGRSWTDGAWGPGLFPDDSDVACGGPRLLEDGRNVAEAHVVSENFESSGIGPDAPLPRTAACVTADGSVLLVTAQHDTVKARGFPLKALADYLLGLGCQDALNLDGGGSTAFWQPDGYFPGTEDRSVYHAVLITRVP